MAGSSRRVITERIEAKLDELGKLMIDHEKRILHPDKEGPKDEVIGAQE
jgi:hypothetical protein